MEQMEKQQAGEMDYEVDSAGGFTRGETMSMSEAVARSTGGDNNMAVLETLNRDSENSALGALFEYETA